MILVSSCCYLCQIHWSQVLSRERRCGWSSADRRCSNYIWVINNLIAYKGVSYIRGLTVVGTPAIIISPFHCVIRDFLSSTTYLDAQSVRPVTPAPAPPTAGRGADVLFIDSGAGSARFQLLPWYAVETWMRMSSDYAGRDLFVASNSMHQAW